MARTKKSETETTTVVAPSAETPVAAAAPKVVKPAKVAASAATPSATKAAPAPTEGEKKKKVKVISNAIATDAASLQTVTTLLSTLEVAAENVILPAVAAATPAAIGSTDFTDMFGKLQQVTTLCSSLKSELRGLEKKVARELKLANKANAKRKRKSGNRSPSGFVKPTLISPDLATFLGKPAGTEMARTEVTREINAYIRSNELQDKTNGRKINADAKLTALLKLDASKEDLTYFNLQRYMSPHFYKAPVVAAAPVVV